MRLGHERDTNVSSPYFHLQPLGTVIVTCNGSTSHNAVTLEVSGAVSLQLSPRKVGIFEAFHNNIKPLQVSHYDMA